MNNISYIFDDYQWTCVGTNLIGDMVYPPQSNKCAIMLSKVLNTFSLTKTLCEKKNIPFVANFSCKGISKSERTIISRNKIRSSIGWGKILIIISPKYIRSRYMYIIKTSVSRRLNILCIMFKIIAFYTRFWYFILDFFRQCAVFFVFFIVL
jgi:hypothetical protein